MGGYGYNIDFCFVVDTSYDMAPILEHVKARIKELLLRLKIEADNVKHIKQLRCSLVTFTDFAVDGDQAICSSDFFDVTEGGEAFQRAVDTMIQPNRSRGGDCRHNALEALFIAMNQDWTPLSMYQNGRHYIVLITNAPPLPLGARDGFIGYDKDDYPENIAELEEIWKEREAAQGAMKSTPLNSKKKYMMLYAPTCPDWDAVRRWVDTLSYVVDTNHNGIDMTLLDDTISELCRWDDVPD